MIIINKNNIQTINGKFEKSTYSSGSNLITNFNNNFVDDDHNQNDYHVFKSSICMILYVFYIIYNNIYIILLFY